ncbi:unnamed protein product [Parascedosporium putredinis]|uniref:HTH La-type RNA-binding domain-containing protein n=1 Tax=Parascedosporium putredinis TaxID=1442378 RepID=A0A9P1H0F8_9PEZI|nr:unnamed protein product [Parascedosporium putredinis]CAI7992762.1 unnamed protein product [Parascedosporium putredinis]
MPTATAPFSYAQAAKGQKFRPQDITLKNSPDGDVPEPAALPTDARPDGFQAIQEAKMNSIAAATAPSVSDASCTTQNDTAPSLGTSSGDSRRDDDTSSELSAQRSVKGARSQGPGRRPTQSRPTSSGADNKRNRREKKSKTATNGADSSDKASSEEAETVKETPPPRRDAQMAKVQQTGNAQPVKPSAPPESLERELYRQRPQPRKGGDGEAARKNGFTKNDARRATDATPSDDVASWPTPNTVSKEEKRKSIDKAIDFEKVEKPTLSDDPAGLKAKQNGKKDWVKMDFVPTVNFQTPLPQHKGARPRGGARGGREGTTRGGHAASATKDGEKGSSGAPAATAKANGETREAAREGPTHPRGSSVPPMPTKRGSVDAPTTREQRKHSVPGTNKSKDQSSNEHGREKHDTRGERTRGGPRNRGNYHGSSSQLNSQHSSFNGYPSNGAVRQNPYSPPVRQNQFNQSFGPSATRGGRGGRGGSGPSRGAASSNNGPGRHAQPAVVSYDHTFHGASVMSYPQTPPQTFYVDPYLVSALSTQLSWYFSIQNLCRDIFLRKNMDSQGFAPLSLVAGFNRLVVGTEDGIERLRTVNNPIHWVLPMSERNEAAQNDGPVNFFHPGQQQYPVHPNMVPGNFHPNGPAMNHYGAFGEVKASPKGSIATSRDTVLKPTVAEFSPRAGAGDGSFAGSDSAAHTPNEKSEEEANIRPQDASNANVAAQES